MVKNNLDSYLTPYTKVNFKENIFMIFHDSFFIVGKLFFDTKHKQLAQRTHLKDY